MKYRLQCEFCNETFVHIGNAFPDECPLCHAYVGLDGKPEVTLPAISLKANKAPDQLYRSMEEGAQHRINMAAEITGQPVSDFAHMKQTNMRDGIREGDMTAVIHTPSDMTATFSNSGEQQHAAAIANVRAERDPRARGAGQMPIIRELHQRHAQDIIARSRQN